MGGSAATAVVFQACGVPEKELLVQSSVEMPEDLVEGFYNWYATLCTQCPAHEGIVVRVLEGRAKKVEGNVDYPLNRGKHGARCEASLQALYHPDRISAPLVRSGDRGSGRWNEISWSDATARIADSFNKLADKSQAVLVTNPVNGPMGLVVQRFAQSTGARHMGFETIEQTNLRRAIKQVFDQDRMPDFDLERSQYILSFGADFLSTWVSPTRYNIGYGKFRQGDRTRGKFVQIEPRLSSTAASADQWVHVNPGREGMVALSIAQVLVADGLADAGAAATVTGSLNLAQFAPDAVSATTGVPAETIKKIAHDMAAHKPALVIGGGPAGASSNGFANLVAIFSLNYLLGSVGQPGGVIFNPPPALPGVPVAATVGSFADFQALTGQMNAGQVQLLMVRGANPVYGLPDGAGFKRASFNVPLIVSFSSYIDDTAAMADIILPENEGLEDWGADIPNPGPGYQVVGFQQPVVRPFFQDRSVHLGTKNFGDALRALAQVIGADLGLPGTTYRDVLQDAAQNLFNSGRGSVRAPTFEAFWNGVLQRGGWWDTESRFTGAAPAPKAIAASVDAPSFGNADASYNFYLVPFESNALGDGSGARLPWLQALPDPVSTAVWHTWVEINIRKAEELDIREGDIIRITSPQGSIEALAWPSPAAAPDALGVPIGQGHTAGGRYSENRGSNVLSILSPVADKDTGALAWAATKVRIEKTGNWKRLSKFENTKPDLSIDPNQAIIKVTSHDT